MFIIADALDGVELIEFLFLELQSQGLQFQIHQLNQPIVGAFG